MRVTSMKGALYGSLLVGTMAVGPMALAESTGENKSPHGVHAKKPNADQGGNDKTDLQLAATIRRAVVRDKDLSISAHNVKIIAQHGVVTLKGPVRSEAEKQSVLKKAEDAAGADNVRDELEIARSR